MLIAINLDKAIQVKYVNAAQQIADVATKGPFSQECWILIDDTSNIFLQPVCDICVLLRRQHVETLRSDVQRASLGKAKATPWTLSTQKKRWTRGDERRRSQRKYTGNTLCRQLLQPHPNTVRKEDCDKDPTRKQLGETQCNLPHHHKKNTGQSSRTSRLCNQRPQHGETRGNIDTST